MKWRSPGWTGAGNGYGTPGLTLRGFAGRSDFLLRWPFPAIMGDGDVREQAMADWRFYGREAELAELRERLHLDRRLEERRFGAYFIAGRRGIGKSELVRRTMELAGDDTPFIFMEIEEGSDAADCFEDLRHHVNERGYGALLDDMPSPDMEATARLHFATLVRHLIGKGAVVAFDEFHHARGGGLVGGIKKMIDDFTSVSGRRKAPGKLLMLGSHQQHLRELFGLKSPLHGRAEPAVKMRQWTLRTLMEIADEHGLLDRPDRFLTLWTAYGGVPRYWQNFIGGTDVSRLRDYRALEDGDEWRRRFIAAEGRLLEESSELYTTRAFVEFRSHGREALLVLARRPDRALTAGKIASRIRSGFTGPGNPPDAKRIQDEMMRLKLSMQAVTGRNEFLGAEGNTRWMIDDLNGLFQLHVFPELFDEGKGGDDADLSVTAPRSPIGDLVTLEGVALERMVVGWLANLPDTRWSQHGSWRHGMEHDVDVTAMTDEGEGTRLLLGTCKRDARSHDTGKIESQFDAFLDSIADVDAKARRRFGWNVPENVGAELANELANAWQDDRRNRRHVAFSTEMPESERARLVSEGFECFDITDMAARHGFGPKAREAKGKEAIWQTAGAEGQARETAAPKACLADAGERATKTGADTDWLEREVKRLARASANLDARLEEEVVARKRVEKEIGDILSFMVPSGMEASVGTGFTPGGGAKGGGGSRTGSGAPPPSDEDDRPP